MISFITIKVSQHLHYIKFTILQANNVFVIQQFTSYLVSVLFNSVMYFLSWSFGFNFTGILLSI